MSTDARRHALRQLAALAGGAWATVVQAQAQATPDDAAIAKEAAPFRRVAEEFVERAIASDTPSTLKLLSPLLVARMGPEQARAVLQRQLQPFFADGRGIGANSSITRVTDSNGNRGFAFHFWLLPKAAGPARPFVLHVVQEGRQRVVANVLPNQRVEGQHPPP